MPTLMERQLDPNAAYLLQKAIEKRGIEVLTERQHQRHPRRHARSTAVRLEDGRTLPADLVVMAVGIRPNTALAKEAGLEVKRGLVVDDHLRTSDREHLRGRRMRRASRPVLRPGRAALRDGEDARRHARRRAGRAATPAPRTSTKLKVTGVDLFSAGDFSEGDENDEIVLRDPSRGVYKRVVLRDNRIVGAVLYGDTADGSWYFDLLKKSADITSMRDTLIFGQAYQGGGAAGPGRRPSRPCRTTRRSAAATASARARSRRRSPPRA